MSYDRIGSFMGVVERSGSYRGALHYADSVRTARNLYERGSLASGKAPSREHPNPEGEARLRELKRICGVGQ